MACNKFIKEKKMTHQLHKLIGTIIRDNFSEDFKVILDQACGGRQNIPLFFYNKKSRETEVCDVDILIMKNRKVKVIFEIEETNVKPTQVCGKFLTSALASYYIPKDYEPFGMDKSVLFVQVLDISNLKEGKTKKIKQWQNIEKAIQGILPIKNSNIDNYKLFYGDISDFRLKGEKRGELIGFLQKYLSGSLEE